MSTDTYATREDVVARVSSAYTVPENVDAMLVKASELVDFATQGRAGSAFNTEDDPRAGAVTKAVCDQIEFWLEVGEEHDVTGLHGAQIGGRVQVQNLPGYLGQRAMRTLMTAGLYWAGAGVM